LMCDGRGRSNESSCLKIHSFQQPTNQLSSCSLLLQGNNFNRHRGASNLFYQNLCNNWRKCVISRESWAISNVTFRIIDLSFGYMNRFF
jgi:hypothetical protein